MARTIDKERKVARLQEIAEAVSRVMARRGAGLASLRGVADEMGCSIGVLTHHFESKDDLYLYTWRYLVGELFGEALAAGGRAPSLSQLERILVAALPTTADRRERWRQWMAFLGAAVSGGVVMEEERRSNVRFLRALTHELQVCVDAGQLPTNLPVKTEARALMALVDGLGVDAVLHPRLYSAVEQKRIVRRHLARLSVSDA
jgi:AcrR family transcriptional regulator